MRIPLSLLLTTERKEREKEMKPSSSSQQSAVSDPLISRSMLLREDPCVHMRWQTK